MQFITVFFSALLNKKLYFFWLPRFFGLLLIPGFFFDIEVLLFFQTVLLLHANLGLGVIIEDYIHLKIIKVQFLFLVKLLPILITNISMLYLL